jgi:LPPG:FO 2-phospho-L-lactate transferase
MITVLCGGVGAARMLQALRGVAAPSTITGIVNTGDDLTLHGLRICPDLDTITYTLAGLNNDETGWGLTGESWRVMDELERLGGEAWFRLGDRDLATHLYRTQRLHDGATLLEVTAELCDRLGVDVRLLPMSEEPVATAFETVEHGRMSFQDYFVRHHHDVTVTAIEFEGAQRASPAPGVLEALEHAERIVISPSNPLISIAPILAVPGVQDVLERRRDAVVAVSPLVAGRALKGPAERLLRELGHEPSPAGIAALYVGVAGTLVIDELDQDQASSVRATGLACRVTTTVMSEPDAARELAKVVLDG